MISKLIRNISEQPNEEKFRTFKKVTKCFKTYRKTLKSKKD